MGQRPRSTEYDLKFPWLGTLPWCGAEGEDETGDDKPKTGDDTGSSGSTDDKGTGSGTETISKAEFDALMERMKAADKNRTTAEAKLRELEDKDKAEVEVAKRDLDEAKANLSKKDEDLKKLRVENAFLTDNTHKWVDSSAALQLVDLTDVSIDDETGKVSGLPAALKKLAESKPYLVKAADDDGASSSSAPASGNANDGKNGKGKGGVDEKALAEKFPALRGRI